jgi:1-phosphofructokinase
VSDDAAPRAGPILTITPNPSLDLLFEVERLVWDDANRIDAPRRRAGGQGINVARAAHALGGECVPLALLGGRTGDELRAMLASENAGLIAVPIEGESRLFVGVRTADGATLLLNPQGPPCTAADETRLLDATADAIARLRTAWVACCGSVPPGIDARLYARVGTLAHEAGAAFVADCDGELLRHAAPLCDALVPNVHEAARLVGRPITGTEEAAHAAHELRQRGARFVAITMGEAGAVAASAGNRWCARPPPHTGRGSAVGAGDAFLAALLLALRRGDAPPDALGAAVAAGSAVLRSKGTALLDPTDYRAVLRGVHTRPL